jgi:LacI family transcriptional regulator, repressor for deo operon, udp, cdd, tsx, nupC, and nupG
MRRVKTRLEDIAARAGVSMSTVSRVVNGKPGVADQTRRTVLAALELLGYDRPSQSARLRSGLVGLIVPELDNPVFPLFVQETENALAAHGYAPLLCTATPVVQENEYIDVVLDRGVAGIVFIAGRHANIEVDHSRYDDLRVAGVPMVFINGYVEGLDAVFVSTDDIEAMRRAVEHLRSLGHRRVGCVMGPARYVTSQRKVDGFLQALKAMREEVGTDVGLGDDLVVHSVYSVEGGQTAMETLLERGVTAVVCGNDLMALGAIRAARARGLQVPQDVSVVGYDDSPMLAFTDPPLTTMRQNVVAMSRHAVDALLDEFQGAPHPRREVLFAAELMVRASTGPLSSPQGQDEGRTPRGTPPQG